MSWLRPHMQIHVALRNVGGLGEHVTVTCFGLLLPYTFFNFFASFFGLRRARTSGPILTI